MNKFDLLRCHVDYSIFYKISTRTTIFLVGYVNDIIITGTGEKGIMGLKAFLQMKFYNKGLGKLKYFLHIGSGLSSQNISLSQKKYVLNLLDETEISGCKTVVHVLILIV